MCFETLIEIHETKCLSIKSVLKRRHINLKEQQKKAAIINFCLNNFGALKKNIIMISSKVSEYKLIQT